jgi:hypothetical protein
VAVLLAFVAAALSFSVLAYSFMRTGAIQATPLFGGLLMLALGLSGYSRLRQLSGPTRLRRTEATPLRPPPR